MNVFTYKDTDAKNKVSRGQFGAPVDGAGNATNVKEGSVAWSNSNPAIGTVQADPDNGPYAYKFTFSGKVGSVDVGIKANADLDNSGDSEISGLVTYVVELTEATGFGEATIAELQDT